MKNRFILIFSLLAAGLAANAQSAYNLQKLTINYENFATSTAENVKCEFFTATFKKSIKTIEIRDINELKSLSLWYKGFSVVHPKAVDVRLIIQFHFKHHTDEYCMDRFGHFVGCETGKAYSNKKLASFLMEKCKPHLSRTDK